MRIFLMSERIVDLNKDNTYTLHILKTGNTHDIDRTELVRLIGQERALRHDGAASQYNLLTKDFLDE